MEIKSSIALCFFRKIQKFKLHQGGPRPPRKSYANLLIRTRKSYKIPCTKPWFFPSKFRKISLFIKVLKIGTFGRFLTEWKIHNLAIFLPNTIVTGMPYLPAKDELVSLNRLSSRGLWKRYNSNVFDQQLYGVGQHFHFLPVFSKKKTLWQLWLWFSKKSHQRVFSDRIWRISKFPFWRQILDILQTAALEN